MFPSAKLHQFVIISFSVTVQTDTYIQVDATMRVPCFTASLAYGVLVVMCMH